MQRPINTPTNRPHVPVIIANKRVPNTVTAPNPPAKIPVATPGAKVPVRNASVNNQIHTQEISTTEEPSGLFGSPLRIFVTVANVVFICLYGFVIYTVYFSKKKELSSLQAGIIVAYPVLEIVSAICYFIKYRVVGLVVNFLSFIMAGYLCFVHCFSGRSGPPKVYPEGLQEITINVHAPEKKIYKIKCNENFKVSDLMNKIEEVLDLPPARQRLIVRGRTISEDTEEKK